MQEFAPSPAFEPRPPLLCLLYSPTWAPFSWF